MKYILISSPFVNIATLLIGDKDAAREFRSSSRLDLVFKGGELNHAFG